MLISTFEYRFSYLHGRYMVENYINGHYDSFRRSPAADVATLVGGDFWDEVEYNPTFTLTLDPSGAPHAWVIATFVGETKLRERAVTEDQVREFFEVMVIPFEYRQIGDDVDANYLYTKEYAASVAAAE